MVWVRGRAEYTSSADTGVSAGPLLLLLLLLTATADKRKEQLENKTAYLVNAIISVLTMTTCIMINPLSSR